MPDKILVTGATGQIGAELTLALRERYGADRVVAVGHRRELSGELAQTGPCCRVDVRDAAALDATVSGQRITVIYHLAALLSAVAEARPMLAWDINMNGLLNVLESARKHGCQVFFPSSVAAFGPGTPVFDTPQDTVQHPATIYGITKVAGELLCDYYHRRYGVDARGVRYPGLISNRVPPGGGTTDYAVDIFYAAIEQRHYDCFLRADTQLDMMYMPDAIAAAIRLMETDAGRLTHRSGFNVTAMNFTPAQLAAAIRQHLPDFTIDYAIDPLRQAIADSWPRHMDDSAARAEWGWQPRFDLPSMTADMLAHLAARLRRA
ncbi:MAG: NAD-dependent epimerase/dehydratase family protein [Nitrosomonas sp.]|nr:MAG: NAD-dependent epimerase/dehydratase family protein [Nitrosomonas sp.]